MRYEWKRVEKSGGGYRLSRVAVKAPKGAVTIEPAEPTTVAKVDVDSAVPELTEVAETPVAKAAVSVPTTKKTTTRKKKS